MDEELQRIIKLRPLQIKCAAYSASSEDYRKILKTAYANECKKLANVEILLDKTNLKMPPTEKLPPLSSEMMDNDNSIKDLLQEISVVKAALNLLK